MLRNGHVTSTRAAEMVVERSQVHARGHCQPASARRLELQAAAQFHARLDEALSARIAPRSCLQQCQYYTLVYTFDYELSGSVPTLVLPKVVQDARRGAVDTKAQPEPQHPRQVGGRGQPDLGCAESPLDIPHSLADHTIPLGKTPTSPLSSGIRVSVLRRRLRTNALSRWERVRVRAAGVSRRLRCAARRGKTLTHTSDLKDLDNVQMCRYIICSYYEQFAFRTHLGNLGGLDPWLHARQTERPC